jgi:hypothetical protein
MTTPGPHVPTPPIGSLVAVDELTNTTTGCWHVMTETATYMVDLDRRVAVRQPGHGAPPGGDELPAIVAALRRDGQEFTVVRVVTCRVGERMVLIGYGINADPSFVTHRETTIVQSILSDT